MKIAVVGATGLVGRTAVKILLDKKLFKPDQIELFASKKSDGKVIEILGEKFVVKELCKKNIKKYDYAIFCAGGAVSLKYALLFAKKGTVVVDNSSAFRRNKKVPLVVPEINIDTIKKSKIVANPNCSTIGASLPIFAIDKIYPIKRVLISTYQAVSGAGQKGVNDLVNNTTTKFTYKINSNLIPQIDRPLKNGYTFEEDKMDFELKKILQNKKLKIATTCVRVPVINCHSESLNIEFFCKPNLNKIRKQLQEMPGVILYDDLEINIYPMPIVANGKSEVFVGRLRKDTSNENAINLFISFDNILKGAAYNAVQIVEKLINAKN